jgi:hypothetical protein
MQRLSQPRRFKPKMSFLSSHITDGVPGGQIRKYYLRAGLTVGDTGPGTRVVALRGSSKFTRTGVVPVQRL